MKTKEQEMKESAWGCYGDGALGHRHTREKCAMLLHAVAGGSEIDAIVAALRGEMSDDAREEQEACEWLDIYAGKEGSSWGWQDGDFGLWPNEEEGK